MQTPRPASTLALRSLGIPLPLANRIPGAVSASGAAASAGAGDRFTLPADGWIHVVPLGEYSHPEVGLQILDRAAADAMVANFRTSAATPNFPGLRLDYDHFSYDPEKSSEAAGWIVDLDNRADGLWAKVRWVNTGRQAVEDGRYRLVSPVFTEGVTLGQGRVRPTRLDSVALTNNPNLRGMVPVTNRDDASASPGAARDTGTSPRNTHCMKLLANRLKLQADASEESILAALDALVAQRDQATAELGTLKNRLSALETDHAALLKDQVEADLAPLVAAKTDEAAISGLRTALLANRTVALPVLKGLIAGLAAAPAAAAAGTQGATLHNRTAGQPATPAAAGAAPTVEQIDNLVSQIQANNRCDRNEAFRLARAQKPEWFTPRR